MFDVAALSALAEGVEIDLEDAERTKASAQRLSDALHAASPANGVEVVAEYDDVAEKHRLAVRRMHHGNVRVSVLDADFVRGADYAVLAKSAKTFLAWSAPAPSWRVAKATSARNSSCPISARPCNGCAAKPSAA